MSSGALKTPVSPPDFLSESCGPAVGPLGLFPSVISPCSSAVGAADPQSPLQLRLLEAGVRGVHQVVDVVQGPHGGGEPGLHVAVLLHEEHAEVIPVDLQRLSHVVDVGASQRLRLRLTLTCREASPASLEQIEASPAVPPAHR